MALLSQEAERELLSIVDRRFSELVAFQQANADPLDLIPREVLLEKLEISSQTLRNWEKLGGLQRYQPPLEDSKKIYYRKTDIYKFLAVGL